MIDRSALTGNTNYFEDFTPGLTIRHARGKTVTALDNVLITNLVMNTAAGHFDEHLMSQHPVGKIVVYGGVTLAMVLGLATQDCCEQAIAELRLDNVKLLKPVHHGDTIYAISEVLSAQPTDRADAGIVRFRHHGFNQRDEPIARVEREALIKHRP